jgi:ATP-binding cassette subfamily C (CFTR/MRP) protein 1
LHGVKTTRVSVDTPLTPITATPKILLALVPLGFFYLHVQRYFIRTSRDLNQLTSQSSSLAYTHLQNVYAGISTIRAFNQLDRFKHEMEQHIDTNQRACFAEMAVDCWLFIRLEVLGAVTTAAVACLAIMSGTSAAMIGVALVNTQRITSILSIQVRSVVYLEGHLASLERIVEYADLPAEGGEIASIESPSTWPEQGAITFHNYSARYREELNNVLHSLNFTIESGQKIGVVGRTGAGKSSLALALYVLRLQPAVYVC